MSASSKRKNVAGITICADPAREQCFHVAQDDAEMQSFEDSLSEAARRERLHRLMNNEMGALEIAAHCLADFPDPPWELLMILARHASQESRQVRDARPQF